VKSFFLEQLYIWKQGRNQ